MVMENSILEIKLIMKEIGSYIMVKKEGKAKEFFTIMTKMPKEKVMRSIKVNGVMINPTVRVLISIHQVRYMSESGRMDNIMVMANMNFLMGVSMLVDGSTRE